MGFFSDAWDDVKDAGSSAVDSIKDAGSSAWDSTKDAITDVTGVESLNTLLMTGGLAMAPAQLAGKGIFGETLYDAISPLMGQQQGPPGGGAGGGALSGTAPSSLNFGAGGPSIASNVQNPGSAGISSLFGNSGYSAGANEPMSSALLRSNPDAYSYAPLANSLA